MTKILLKAFHSVIFRRVKPHIAKRDKPKLICNEKCGWLLNSYDTHQFMIIKKEGGWLIKSLESIMRLCHDITGFSFEANVY